jgi:hypothetical protein
VPITPAAGYTTNVNMFNIARFAKVKTTAVRLEVQLQKEFSGGVLEWRSNELLRHPGLAED